MGLLSYLNRGFYNGGPGSRRQRLTTHVVVQDADGKDIVRPILKPRDTSKYTPRARNGTPRRLHAEGRQ